MSNIYIQEPPTSGKVLLKTSAGDIDIELWSKETPKACRNFIQLCLEGYYNGTIFHRVVKDFIVQGGDPTGSGEGGESIYGHPFKDEFHTRLRFCRRGLVAMANAGKDDNASQFFFTMGPCQELQNKHTIFGKVTGDTVYNMLKLQEGIVDCNERPQFPQKIVKTTILDNPFPDIVPRSQSSESKKDTKRKREKKSGVKDFKLLSFGEEAEEDEEETERENKRFSGRSKSTHDLLDDPKLSAVPAIENTKASSESSDLSEDETVDRDEMKQKVKLEELDKVKSKLMSQKTPKMASAMQPDDDQDIEAYSFGQDERDERKKRTEAIKQEYRELRRNMRKRDKTPPISHDKIDQDEQESEIIQEYKKDREEYEQQKNQMPAKGVDRESFTMALLAKFQKKLNSVKEQAEGDEEDTQDETGRQYEEEDAALGKDGGKWMGHKLHFEENSAVLAKDANTKDQKGGDWFEIDDPRNPINQRRRQATKPSGSKHKN